MKIFTVIPSLVVAVLLLFPESVSADVNPKTHTATIQNSWSHEVVYEILVDRFATARGLGNVPGAENPYDFQGGTFAGIVSKLPYLKDLGITAILLNPVTTSRDYHGYSVTDLYSIEKAYGGEDEYRKLVSAAHSLGIKVLFDLVLNHTSGDSPLTKEHPDWFRPISKVAAVNEPLIPQVWSKSTFYLLRDFDQERPEVYEYLLKATLRWIDLNIDGFRMDGVTLVSPQFWEKFNSEIRLRAKSGFLILGEIFYTDLEYLNYYLPYFDAFFDFPTAQEVIPFVQGVTDGYGLKKLWMLDKLFAHPGILPFTFIDNHDVSRFAAALGTEDRIRAIRIALATIFTGRGVPTVLYGTEIGLSNDMRMGASDWDKSRSVMRFDQNETHPLFQFLRTLAGLRKKFDFNNCHRLDISAPLAARVSLLKDVKGQILFVAINPSRRDFKSLRYNLNFYPPFPREGEFKLVIGGTDTLVIKDGFLTLDLPAFGVKIYEYSSKSSPSLAG